MAVPAFLQYAEADPGSGIGGALQSGIQTYGALSQISQQKKAEERAEAESKSQLAGADISQQAAKLNLQALPGQLSREQQQQNLQLVGLAHKNALDKMTANQTLHQLYGSRLSDVMALPPEQRAQSYSNLRTEMKGLGYNEKHMPESFNTQVEEQAKIASLHTPANADNRKFLQQITLQQLKNKGTIQASQAEAQGKIATEGTPEQVAMIKAEAPANAKYASDASDNSGSAQQVKDDANEIMAAAGKIPEKFGLIRGGMIRLNPEGQRAYATMNKMILDLFGQMKRGSRAGNLFFRILKGAKPSPNMSYSALKKISDTYIAASNFVIEKNNFISFMKDNGVHDRNKLQAIWNSFNDYAPSIRKGEVDPQQAKRWPEFLQKNPQFLGGKTKVQLHQGFKMPEGTELTQ